MDTCVKTPLFDHFEAQTIKMFLMLFIAAGLAKRRHSKRKSRAQSSNAIETRRRTKREAEEHDLHRRASPIIEPELKQGADHSNCKKSYRYSPPKEEPRNVEPKTTDLGEPLDEDPPGIEMNFGEGFPMDPLDDPLAIDMHEYR